MSREIEQIREEFMRNWTYNAPELFEEVCLKVSTLEEKMKEADLRHQEDNQVIGYWTRKVKELENETSYMESLTRAKMEAESEWAKGEIRIKELEDKLAQVSIERQIFERASLDGDEKIENLVTECKKCHEKRKKSRKAGRKEY